MAIKGLIPQLSQTGCIKIGDKGEKKTTQYGKEMSQPEKLDHFIVTTMQRDAADRLMLDTALMNTLAPEGTPKVESRGRLNGLPRLTVIPIRLLYDEDELNFQTRLACYKKVQINGKEQLACWCSGDRESAERRGEGDGCKPGDFAHTGQVSCPCERWDPMYAKPDKCKTIGTLQCLIDGVNRIGGVWRFRTTGWNSVNSILASMWLVKTLTGGGQVVDGIPVGPIAGIPLNLVVGPKSTTIPTTGQMTTIQVVHLEYAGAEKELKQIGYGILKERIEHQINMRRLEGQAQRLLMAPIDEPLEIQQETAEEFFPEDVVTKPASSKTAGAKKKSAPSHTPAPEPEESKAAGTQSQDPGNGGDPEPPEATAKENLTVHPAITLPALMELAKKPDGLVDLPIGLVTTKGVPIGQWLDWGPNLGGDMQVTLELADNLGEVTAIDGHQGLTIARIEKSFNEAGIILKVVTAEDAQQEGKERLVTEDIQRREDFGPNGDAITPGFMKSSPPQGGRSTAAAPRGNGGHGEQRKSLF